MRLLLLPIVLFSTLAFAQSWCPQGATWTFGSDAFGNYGFTRFSYAGDTVVGALPGQRIDLLTGSSNYFNDQQDFYSEQAAVITGLHEDVISIWTPTEQAWDTLFWLSAVPGDSWSRSNGPFGPCDPPDSLVVVDTTTVLIDGIPLRRWSMEQRSNETFIGTEIFTERLGWSWNIIPYPACLIVDGPVGMRCYSDLDISVNFTPYGCETLVGIHGATSTVPVPAFPNPGSDQFTLSLPPGQHTITLFDATGRMVLEQRTAVARPVINTEALPAGLYRITVVDEQGGMSGATWVKE